MDFREHVSKKLREIEGYHTVGLTEDNKIVYIEMQSFFDYPSYRISFDLMDGYVDIEIVSRGRGLFVCASFLERIFTGIINL